MAKTPNLSNIANIYTSTSTINNNNELIKNAFQNTLSRDGSTPNQMEADLDMNSNDILNVGRVTLSNGEDLQELVDEAEQYRDEAKVFRDQAEVIVSGVVDLEAKRSVDTFTGDGSNVTFTLPIPPSSKSFTQVFVDGDYISKEDYEVVGNDIVFDTPPSVGSVVEINTLEEAAVGTLTSEYVSYGDTNVKDTLDGILAGGVGISNFYSSVSDMKADNTLKVGQFVQTYSYYKTGDIPEDPTGPVFVVGSGQSNMVNRTYSGGRYPSNNLVYVWLSTTDGGTPSWIQNPNFETTMYYLPTEAPMVPVGDGRNHIALSYAHRIAERTGREVRLVIDARGGRPIEDWIGSGVSSVRYTSLKNNVEAAAISAGLGAVDVFMWQQGEANSANSSTLYQGKLNSLYSQLTAETWWSGETVMIAGEPVATNTSYNNIKTAINDWANEDPILRRVASSANLPHGGDNIHFSGPAVYALGTLRYWAAHPFVAPMKRDNIGGAIYRITNDSDPVDEFGEHTLNNGLKARIVHNNTIHGEWWGIIGVEGSARLSAINTYIRQRSPIGAGDKVGQGMRLIQTTDFHLSEPVILGGAPQVHFCTMDMGGVQVEAKAGGGLNSSSYMLTFRNFHRGFIVPPRLACNGLTRGAYFLSNIRTDVKTAHASEFHTYGIHISGNHADSNFWFAAGQQWADADGEVETVYDGSVIYQDGQDFNLIGGNPGRAKYCYHVGPNAANVNYENVHPFNGNTTYPRTNSIVIFNQGGYRQTFRGCYLDNGWVVDDSGSIHIEDSYHFLLAGAGTWSHPYIRARIDGASLNQTTVSNYQGSIGFYLTDPNNLITDQFGPSPIGNMSSPTKRVNVFGGRYNLITSDLSPAVADAYFVRPVSGTHSDIAFDYWKGNQLTRAIWGQGLLRINNFGDTSSAVQFQGGETGIAGNVNGDFFIKAGSSNRWQVGALGRLFPLADNSYAIGSASNRVSVIFAANGTINTSDRNDKEQFRDLSEVEKAVALKLKPLIKAFKFKDAVVLKGESARWHFGVIAQDIEEAFASEGLVAEEYGVFCRDVLEDGSTRLGVRYDELSMFILASL